MDQDVVGYYDRLAPDYDASRFSGSYGRFIDRQERVLLARLLPTGAERVLDIGCGTGRLSDFATHGCDASPRSIALAEARHPDKSFAVADACALPFPSASFDAAFCFHVLMHLDGEDIATLIAEAARVLSPGGVLVADVPSAFRRNLIGRQNEGWHGATALGRSELAAMAGWAGLYVDRVEGIAMLPVHRVPSAWRLPLAELDHGLCALAPSLSSYLVARFVADG
jgi:SAM-dependent methyltransferase